MISKIGKWLLKRNVSFQQSDSGSGSAASSVSPVVPIQPSKPVRKRRPAPKPPVQQQPVKQQSETIICHSRTSSDSSGYHEASVLSESPDSNNSSLPDSLPRRSKLPPAETSNDRGANKLSRSLSNLHQASTSATVNSSLKPAQSVSCLVPSRKKKPAPAPPVAIAEEKEEKSATLPPCTRLMEAAADEGIEVQHQVNNNSLVPEPSPINVVVPVTRQRITKPKAPVPRPRSTSFENTRPNLNVFDKLEVICSKKMASESQNADNENAMLEAEIERMFDQATREHISLESGVELSRGPSPDWNWEYRLPAPPTFRDDVTVSSLADLNLSPPLRQILFEPLEKNKELINEESESDVDGLGVELNLEELKPINENKLTDVHTASESVLDNTEKEGKLSETNNNKHTDNMSSTVCNGEIIGESYKQNNKQNQKNILEKDSFVSNKSKTLSDSTCVNIINGCDSNEKFIQITPKIKKENVENEIADVKPKIVIINKKSNVEEPMHTQATSKTKEIKADKVYINVKNEEPKDSNKNRNAKVVRSDTVIRVNGRLERSQEQTAILSELATVISGRQQKAAKEAKPEPQEERPQSIPLDNFRITTYTSSKPVQIYKEGRTPHKTAIEEANVVVRRNSFTEEKKGSQSVKRSASSITNLQRRLELSRSNGNLLEGEETPVRHFQRNLRKTTSEISINIDPDEQKGVVRKQETELQSLQVLRSILPQLSQSQGALNTVGHTNEKKEEKPAVCLTTWGERPKRQVSIKTDRDYVVGATKSEPMGKASTTNLVSPTPVSSTATSISVEVVSPVTRLPVTAESTVDWGISRTPRTSVYKAIETGNTKAIKLPDLGRIPVVRGVELKKHPMTSERLPLENGLVLNGHTTFGQTWIPENRRPSYLFGCEPKAPAPTPLAPPMPKLKPVSQRELPKQLVLSDPREELLQSIRNFGKSSLRKVSTR